MTICPHCGDNTIGIHAKYWSTAAHPVKCKRCGGLSYVAKPHGTAWGRALMILPILALGGVVLTGSIWVVPAAVVAWLAVVGYEALVFRRTPMVPASMASADDAKYWEGVGLRIVGVSLIVVAVVVIANRAG